MADDTTFNPEDFGLGSDDVSPAETAAPASGFGSGGSSSGPISFPTAGGMFDLSKMKMVLDVPLKVTVELGRTKLLINDLLQLGQGSVVELDKMAGEPMEVYVNDKLVAMGEVVVVNEKFGIRLTDITSGVGLEELAGATAG